MKWPMVKLGELATHIRNGVSIKQSPDAGGLKITRIETIAERKVNLNKCGYAGLTENDYMDFRLKKGDILISHINSESHLGKCAIFEEERNDIIHGMNLLSFRTNRKVEPKYLYYALSSDSFLMKLKKITKKSVNQASFNVTSFKELDIPLPPLEEQKRIAEIMDKADVIRQKRQQAIALADDFLRSVFLDMFGDPVTNPKGWAVKPLGKDIIHANNGLARRRKEEDNVGDIVLRLQDVQYDGINFDKDLNRITLDKKEKERYQVDIGDILFIRVNGNPNYVGRSTIFNGHVEDVYHNDHIIRLKVSSSFEPKFLSFVFNSNGGRKIIAKKTKTSAGQHTISQAGIEELEIYRPPLEKQKSFVRIMNALMPIIENNFKSDGINLGLFAVLSQKAFSGHL
ncbi:restriction endonuclease subunit S [Aeromonas salmonicida]|nr:restriction endonuclease subunit S [Aeromonas salmonicida]